MKTPDSRIVVVATRNSGKLREFQTLLEPLQCEVRSLRDLAIDEEFDETGRTFAENARIKACGYSRLTHFPVLADDSGLEVDALGGRPGIHSARYGGPGASDTDRIHKLLGELEFSNSGFSARFVCALALAQNGSLLYESKGCCAGIIIREPRGEQGFGYDPIFLFPKLGKTFAELNEAEKNQFSHRARAVSAMLGFLQDFCSTSDKL
jgi:non-canonical purine NTP pyrophosphatase (RdgB/HAM1 family)